MRDDGIKESVIRRMTQLAIQHDAVNLSQGFPNDPPDMLAVWDAAMTVLGGDLDGVERLYGLRGSDLSPGGGGREVLLATLAEGLRGKTDLYNQYSYPHGVEKLRSAIADHLAHHRGVNVDPETEVTVVAGATEGMAVALRTVCDVGDGVTIIEPCHEMYRMQCEIFSLRPRFVALERRGSWDLDLDKLSESLKGCRALVINTPHNPTGRVFSRDVLQDMADLCKERNVTLISDEIYEHILYDGAQHTSALQLSIDRDQVILVSSVSKTGGVTGWRVGWTVTSPRITRKLRAVHDALVIQAPTPLQMAATCFLNRDQEYYSQIAEKYQQRRDILTAGLQQCGFSVPVIEGAYYVYADYRNVDELAELNPTEAAMHLLRYCRVASVPGDNFYNTGDTNRFLRFSFCRDRESLRTAVSRLGRLIG